jgi:ABC-type nitrate/sulfonate/bicarbonate transport system ATPase subunit
MAFVNVSGVSKAFPAPIGRREVLHNVSLAVEQGEFIAIVGSMGCGKSTLLNILSGLVSADSGEIRIGGERVAGVVARALSVEPRFLLLDEPFAQLDSLTRFELQDTLLRVWERTKLVVVMVTHDVDEALYLADRLVLMTDGPEATVGEVMTVPFARPRTRASVLEDPNYYAARQHVIDFLEFHAHGSRPSAIDQVLRERVNSMGRKQQRMTG